MIITLSFCIISYSQAKRQKAQESGRKNDCPHTMSRGGYAKAERDLLAAKRKRLEEASQSDPSVLLSPPSPIRREEKWQFAHQKRSGTYTSEQSRIVGEKIVSIIAIFNYLVNKFH